MLKDYVKQSMNEIRQSEQFMGHFEINKLFETIKGQVTIKLLNLKEFSTDWCIIFYLNDVFLQIIAM